MSGSNTGKREETTNASSDSVTFPMQYRGNYPKQRVLIKSWLNFGDEHEDGEYIEQSFELPVPVDTYNLRALVGRQSMECLAMAHMAYGYKAMKDICNSDPEVGEGLQRMFEDGEFLEAFRDLMISQQGWEDMPETLSRLSPRYFPFDESEKENERRKPL
ncbi:hypothetical protein [Planctobacterium marinum]|uniref:Uncharacterized protein n=1 Tax=Planctobacterium marinum TaxID=1631968 RepID=A0AA48HMR5_9ALTE|nr:hypothetical protein MACH26_18880 [Planctobacterium marinum]